MALIVAGLVVFIFWLYVTFLREWLDAHLQGTRYAFWHEQIEDKLWEKSRTILYGRLYQLGGLVLAIQTGLAAAGVDTTPFTDEAAKLVPEKWRGLAMAAFFILTGWGINKLREWTSRPLDAKT